MLYDKAMISYQTREGGKVKLTYTLKDNQKEEGEACIEQLTPMYANIYVKQFVLYDGEELAFSFEESDEQNVIHEERGILRREEEPTAIGKFGKLNAMSRMEAEEREKSMTAYRLEERLAEEIFEIN